MLMILEASTVTDVLANGFLSLQFIWWVAISLSGQSVFNIYGTASFVSNEAEEQEPTTFLCITQDFPFAKPESADLYEIEQRVRIYSHSQMHTVA